MLQVRRSQERGHADHGWLNAYHSFSFADYYDPKNMGFSVLRVINEDRIDGGAGFPPHPHRDMEIITYIVDGALEHKDSMGNTAVIRPGEVQIMSAGTGVRHSEFNHFADQKTHLLQIWILTEREGAAPTYEQKSFSDDFARGGLRLVGSRDARDGSVKIRQDVDMYAAHFKSGETATLKLRAGRQAWVQLVKGSLDVNGEKLGPGDAVAVTAESALALKANTASEFIVFDLP